MHGRILCLLIASSFANDEFYKTQFDSSQDQKAERSENAGFVQPLDFSAFTQHFLAGSQNFNEDFFGSESQRSNFLQPFPVPFSDDDDKKNGSGFVQPLRFTPHFDGQASSVNYQPRYVPPKKDDAPALAGKTSYPNKISQAVYSDSADVEVFYPKEKAILPTDHLGRPKPYDGYRAAPDTYYPEETRPVPNHSPKPKAEVVEEEEEQQEEEQVEEVPPPKNPKGIKYQFDETVQVPDLIIKRYPYEKAIQSDDDDYIAEYTTYKEALPSDLEKHFGTPDWAEDKYTVAATENLEKNKNCERREKREADGKICYICREPKTGGSYEQCAYESSTKPNRYYYTGATSSKSAEEVKPQTYRYKRSLDALESPGFEYFVFNDYTEPILRKTREDPPTKRKTKKYAALKKKPKRKSRQPEEAEEDPSAHIENPPESYSGEYNFGEFAAPYTSQDYEGPSADYEGPSAGYEGPDHDNYYDRSDDRISYEGNAPLVSSVDIDLRQKKRPRRGPKSEFEEFNIGSGFRGDYRFGPEYFKDDFVKEEEHQQPASTNTEFFQGNVKIFKNGDVCEKKKKENMLCMVCNNDKTGAVYEQCQYSTKPSGKQYSYGQQKSYSSGDNDRPQRHVRSDQHPEKTNQKVSIMKIERKTFNEGSDDPPNLERFLLHGDLSGAPSEESESKVEAPEEQEGERIEARDGIEGLDEYLKGEKKSYEDNFPAPDESYDQYFKRVFPEFERYGSVTPPNFNPFSELERFRENDHESEKSEELEEEEESESNDKVVRLKDEKTRIPRDFYPDEEDSKKDLEKALGEFKQRDWSKCKKIEKDRLTCYQCINDDGVKNEECMFIEGSNPQSSHVAYHEKKDFVPTTTTSTTESPKNSAESKKSEQIEPAPDTTASETQKLKGDFEKVPTSSEIKIKPRKYPVKKFQKEVPEK